MAHVSAIQRCTNASLYVSLNYDAVLDPFSSSVKYILIKNINIKRTHFFKIQFFFLVKSKSADCFFFAYIKHYCTRAMTWARASPLFWCLSLSTNMPSAALLLFCDAVYLISFPWTFSLHSRVALIKMTLHTHYRALSLRFFFYSITRRYISNYIDWPALLIRVNATTNEIYTHYLKEYTHI